MFKFYFYQIPFMKGGETIPAPNGDAIARYTQYEVAKTETSKPFRGEQGELVVTNFDDPQKARKANYMIMQSVNANGAELYRLAYWLDFAELLSPDEGTGEPKGVRFGVSIDEWGSYVFGTPNGVKTSAFFSGRISVTSASRYAGTHARVPLVAPDYSGKSIARINNVIGVNDYGVIVGTTDEAGNVFSFIVTKEENSANFDSLFGLISAVAGVTKTTRVRYRGGTPYRFVENAKATSIKVIPYFWATDERISHLDDWTTEDEKRLSNFVTCVDPATGKQVDLKIRLFISQEPFTPPVKFTYSFASAFSAYLQPYSRVSLKCGNMSFDFKDDPTVNNSVTFTMHPSPAGEDSDETTIILFMNGEEIDVTSAFDVDFAVNEEMVRRKQTGLTTALRGVSSIIGSVGGAVGGFASGNYFGGVQSIVSGVGSVAGMIEEGTKPANHRNHNSALNGELWQGLISFSMLDDPKNVDIMRTNAERYGYIYRDKPWYRSDLAAFASGGTYLRVEDPTVELYDGGGQNAAQKIAGHLESGVKFTRV